MVFTTACYRVPTTCKQLTNPNATFLFGDCNHSSTQSRDSASAKAGTCNVVRPMSGIVDCLSQTLLLLISRLHAVSAHPCQEKVPGSGFPARAPAVEQDRRSPGRSRRGTRDWPWQAKEVECGKVALRWHQPCYGDGLWLRLACHAAGVGFAAFLPSLEDITSCSVVWFVTDDIDCNFTLSSCLAGSFSFAELGIDDNDAANSSVNWIPVRNGWITLWV